MLVHIVQLGILILLSKILFLKIETITIEEVNRVKASSLDILDSKLL